MSKVNTRKAAHDAALRERARQVVATLPRMTQRQREHVAGLLREAGRSRS